MIKVVRQIYQLAGKRSPKLQQAFILGIIEAMFVKGPMILFLYSLVQIFDGTLSSDHIWTVGGAMAVILLLKTVLHHRITMLQYDVGFRMISDERIKLGNHIRHLPMGYFNDGTIGNISTVISTDFVFMEELAMTQLSVFVSSYLGVILACLMFTILDYRIGSLIITFSLISAIVLGRMQKHSQPILQERHDIQEDLVNAVIEYAKGISITKAFNLSGERSKALEKSISEFRDIMIEVETKYTPTMIVHESIVGAAVGVIFMMAVYYLSQGSIGLVFAFMVIMFVFDVFVPITVLGRQIPMFRIVETGLNRYYSILESETIDKDGEELDLDRFDIEFKDVTFAYESEDVIKNMSFSIPEGSMTALVGKSGSGKTTIANLIARFWDVDQGSVLVGGVDVKKHTCDSLLKNISMVFQKVYLFNDTVLNNLKFAKPEATFEEVVEVCKKARCHDFITQLEQGYDTQVGEGGSTLSGGEKQRISIARAMLKDAPIILLDEATASVDPDNEEHIQDAINELVKNKTLVVIAHNLSTIRKADQILVIEDGTIIQSGKHEDLVKQEGYYNKFWSMYIKEKGWAL